MNVRDFDARHQDVRRTPAHVAGLEPVAPGRLEVHSDLDLRHFDLLLDVQIDEAGDVLQRLFARPARYLRSTGSSGPKMRTTIDSPAPVSTSLIRSLR